MEKELHEKFLSEKAQGIKITRENLCAMARNSELKSPGFKGSHGWCDGFVKRFNISGSNNPGSGTPSTPGGSTPWWGMGAGPSSPEGPTSWRGIEDTKDKY